MPPQNNGGSFVSVTSKCSFGNSKKDSYHVFIRPLKLDNGLLKVMLWVVTCFLVLLFSRLFVYLLNIEVLLLNSFFFLIKLNFLAHKHVAYISNLLKVTGHKQGLDISVYLFCKDVSCGLCNSSVLAFLLFLW